MKQTKLAIAVFVIISLLSITALSQSPMTNIISKTTKITPAISLEENDICTTTFYDEIQDIYGNCVYYSNITSCLNTSGPNTGCSVQQSTLNYQCKTGSTTSTKNTTECKANDYIISMGQGAATLKKQIDYYDWGPCIYSQENIAGNNCLIVTCVSNDDGAFKGQFTDCNAGKSCQRFEICDNGIKTLYKNSREGFVQDDLSFFTAKLGIKEVAE